MNSKWFLFLFLLTFINICNSQIDTVESTSTPDQAFDVALRGRYIPFKSSEETYLMSFTSVDTNNRIIVDHVYTEIINDFGYHAKINGKHGLVGFWGDTLVPFQSDTIYIKPSFILCKDSNSFVLMRPSLNETTYSFEADSIFFSDNLVYHYKNGNVGVVNESCFIPSEYEAITSLNCPIAKFNTSYQISDVYFKVITKSGSLQLINKENKKLLPKNVTEIQCYQYGIISFYDSHWKYLNLSNHEIIDNEGNDIIFYSNTVYKKYNKDRSKGILICPDKIFQGRYDDYFLLDNNYIAVRKDNKVGVIDYQTERMVLPLEYEQIKPTNSSDYFKTYKELKCGITKIGGKTVIPHDYSNILSTGHEEIYVVIKNNQGGVLTNENKFLLTIQYDQISVDSKAIICRKGDNFGLFNLKGRQVVPITYANVTRRGVSGNNIYLFYNSESKIYVANHEDFIGTQPVSHIEFGEDLIKTYKGGSIYVSVLNTDGEVEEVNEYSNLNSFVIPGNNVLGYLFKTSWTIDELEENQQTGLYGRRHLIQYGFSHEPEYTTLRYSRYKNPFGQLEKQKGLFEIIPGIIVENNRYFNDISSKEKYSPFLMNDNAYSPSSSQFSQHTSDKYMLQDTLGALGVAKYSNLVYNEDYPLGEFVYAKNILTGAKLHYHTKKIEITTKENSDLSLSDYFDWLNILGVYKPSLNDLKHIFDPHLGVKFLNSTVMISHPSHWSNKSLNLSFVNPSFYKSCRVLPKSKALFFIDSVHSGTIENFYKSPRSNGKNEKTEPIIKNVADVTEINYTFDNRLLVQSSEYIKFKIHREHPDFWFHKNKYLVDYNNGYLTLKINDSNYVLVKPNHEIVLDCLEEVTYVNGDFFKIKEIGGKSKQIINARSKEIVFKDVIRIEKFNQDYFVITKLAENQKTYILVDLKMEVLKLFTKIIRPYQGDYIWIDYTDNILLDLKNETFDTLNYDKHELYSNGFILFEKDNRKYVRLFGQTDFIRVKDDASFVSFGDKLYGEFNGRHFYINRSLEEVNYKRKMELDILKNQYLILYDGKKTIILNDQNEEVYSSTNEILSFNQSSLYISFYDNDTLKYLTSSGQITTDFEKAISKEINNSQYSLNITENGAGLQIDGELILNDEFKSIVINNQDEFIVESSNYQKIYSSDLEPIGIEGSKIFPVSNSDFYMIKNGEFQYVVKNDQILIDNFHFWK